MYQLKDFSDSYKIVWYLNNLCNFKCEYCLDNMGRDDPRMVNNEIPKSFLIQACKNLLSLELPKYNFTLFGGETTLYPNLHDFISTIYDQMGTSLNDMMFTTNASRGINYFKDFLDFDNRFIIRISIHMEHYTPEIFEVIEYLCQNNLRVFVEIMFNYNYKELVYSSAEKIEQLIKKYNNLHSRIKPIFASIPFDINNYFYNYSNEDMKLFEEYNTRIGYTSYKYKQDRREIGKYCLIGSNKILVDPSGNIGYGCPEHQSRFQHNLFYLSPKNFKEKDLFIQKCISTKPCLHAPIIKFDNKEELENVRKSITK